MANIFFNGDRASKKDAIDSVTKFVEDYCSCIFDAKVVSDDGGQILQVMVEVDEPSTPIIKQLPDFPLDEIIPKWQGWRAVVIKVPPTYIKYIVHGGDE